MVLVLFVCLANICRSPAAEGVLLHLAKKSHDDLDIHAESCGIGGWSVGQPPDERMRQAAHERGIHIEGAASQFNTSFYDKFDYIMAVDHEVRDLLLKHALRPDQKAKVLLITAYSQNYRGVEIPDPYYGGSGAFDHVLDILEDSCAGLLAHIKESK